MALMTTARDVFQTAIHLMDEQNELTGSTQTVDTKEYEFRTLDILNVLRNELWPISDTYEFGFDCPEIKTFEQPINLDPYSAQTIMPYGLAAHLLLGENDAMASFFNQRYQELIYKKMSKATAQWVEIPDPWA